MSNDLEQGLIRPSNRGRINSCPYCKGKTPSKNKEHIFNASWGGKQASKKLICDDCNKRFGDTIDLAFKPITDRILNIWAMAPSRSKKIPHIHIKESMFLGPYSILYKKGVCFHFKQDGEKYDFNFSANSKSEIKRFIDNGEIESVIGKTLSDEQKERLKSQLKYTQETEPEVTQPIIKLSIDLQSQYRSAMHTAIKAILLYTPSTINQFDFKRALDFVFTGHENFRTFAVLAKEFMPLPIETPIANAVSIYFSKKYKKVIGCFNLLNRIKLNFIMADYDGDEDVMMQVSEGFNGDPEMFAFYAKIPNHISALPLVEVVSEDMEDSDIEEQLKDLLVQIQYKDRHEVYKNLTKEFR